MRWLAVALGLCGPVTACGGKSQQGKPSDQVEPIEACFALSSGTSEAVLQASVLAKLGVVLPAGAVSGDESNELVRGQQLVDAVQTGLHEQAVPVESRNLLRGFVAGLLGEATPPAVSGLSESVAAAMDSELDRVVTHWVVGQDATLEALLTSSTTFVNGELAEHYGIPRPVSGDWESLELPAEQRAGIMTLGAFLTRQPLPPGRGTYLAEALSCMTVPPPPQLVDSIWGKEPRRPAKDVVLESYGDDQPQCWACHQYYVGFAIALDRYDELGRYRDSFGGAPIDTSYSLMTSSAAVPAADADGRLVEFATPPELGRALSESAGLRTCLVRKLNQSLGGAELSDPELSCALGALQSKQGSFTSLLAILAPHYVASD